MIGESDSQHELIAQADIQSVRNLRDKSSSLTFETQR